MGPHFDVRGQEEEEEQDGDGEVECVRGDVDWVKAMTEVEMKCHVWKKVLMLTLRLRLRLYL